MDVMILLVTNDKSCFGASLFSLGESLHHLFFRCDFLTNFLTNFFAKGLFLTSTTQTLPTFNGRNCSFDGF